MDLNMTVTPACKYGYVKKKYLQKGPPWLHHRWMKGVVRRMQELGNKGKKVKADMSYSENVEGPKDRFSIH